MTAAQQRKVQRVVHLAAALLLVAYLYAPLEAQLQDAVRFIVLPLLVVTGIAMWQAPRIRRLRKTVGRLRALDVAPSAYHAERGAER
jgi:thiosulfate reductase cytochrome b subunit